MSLIVKVGKAGKRVVKKFLPEEAPCELHPADRTGEDQGAGGGHDLRRWSHGPALQPPINLTERPLTDILLDTLGGSMEPRAPSTWWGDTSENYPDTAGKKRPGGLGRRAV